jgi:hypothetical protein
MCPVGAKLVPADRRDEVNRCFLLVCERTRNELYSEIKCVVLEEIKLIPHLVV